MGGIHWRRRPKASKIKGLEDFWAEKISLKRIKDMAVFLICTWLQKIWLKGIQDKKTLPCKKKKIGRCIIE